LGNNDKKIARTVSQSNDERQGNNNKDKKHGNQRPGWGHGDKNHDHTGPPGHSVRPHKSVKVNNHVNLGTSVNIIAEAGARVVVNIVNNITQIFHINA
jgi:hypothetical protein